MTRLFCCTAALICCVAFGLEAQSASLKDRQARGCDVARAAYGGDPAACLVILFHWPEDEARLKAGEFYLRDQRLLDSIERAETERLDSLQKVAGVRATPAEKQVALMRLARQRRVDSINALRVADERKRDSLEYAVGGNAKRELRRIIDAERDYFYVTNTFTYNLYSLFPEYRPRDGVTARILVSSDSSWNAEAVTVEGWKCTATGSAKNLQPVSACEPMRR